MKLPSFNASIIGVADAEKLQTVGDVVTYIETKAGAK